MTENTAPAQPQTSEPQFAIQKLYMKDVSFESPNAPTIFTLKWEPEINLQLSNSSHLLEGDVYEVVLSITITAKVGDKTAYLVEIHQAGIFIVHNFPTVERESLLHSYCPNVLYPFAREAIHDLINKAGFPTFYLAPINFDAMWAKQQQEQSARVATVTH